MNHPSESEWRLLNVLWRLKKATAREVHDAVAKETDWAYATVKTLLDRLEVKELLKTVKVGPVKVYSPKKHRRDVLPKAVAQFVDNVLGGSMAPLVNYISKSRGLSKEEIADLEKLLEGEET